MQLAIQLAHLFLGVAANRVTDLDVLSLHLKSHAPPCSRGSHTSARESERQALALEAHGAGKSHDLDRARTVLAQCGCGCGCGRPGRVDIVDEDEPGAASSHGPECPGDVAATGGLRQPTLARRPPGPPEKRLER